MNICAVFQVKQAGIAVENLVMSPLLKESLGHSKSFEGCFVVRRNVQSDCQDEK